MDTNTEDRKPQDLAKDPVQGGSLQDKEHSDPPLPPKTSTSTLGGKPSAAVQPQPDPGPLKPNPEILEGTPPAAAKSPVDPDPEIDLLEGKP